ncbi:MAG: NADH-quinone oxidoreductase subunit M [Methanomassiliicoccales archaeon]|nr:MAG: NADH-quinone oxidoreductase subunit M [Methanomassiliicoccales archaeon]
MRMEIPYLSLMILVPLVGTIVSFLLPRESTKAKWVCLIAALISLVISFIVTFAYVWSWPMGLQLDPSGSFAAYEKADWIPTLGMSYVLGVDGLSLPLIVLTHLLVALGIVFSWKETDRPKEFFGLLLLMDLSITGVFMSLDLFLFFIFWELVLIPMYFLIGIWGGPNKHYAAIKFLIYTHVGSVIMLLGIFALYFWAGPALAVGNTFNLVELANAAKLDPTYLGMAFQAPVFVAFFFGFGVKMPMVPFHTWLPDAHVEAPTAGSVVLAGLLLKMGGYGLFRLGLTMFPLAAREMWWLLATFGVVSMVYAAFVCLAQTDLKRLIAYSSISHMGFVLLGASSTLTIGIAGGIFQMFNHGLITAVLFMLAGVAKRSCHTRDISKLTGLVQKMPLFSFILMVSFFASLGLPGLNGFVSEFMVFAGSYESFGRYLIIPLLAIIITGAYYIWTMHKMVFGDFNTALGKIRDLTREEALPLFILLAFIIFFGLYPAPVIGLIEPYAAGLSSLLGGLG